MKQLGHGDPITALQSDTVVWTRFDERTDTLTIAQFSTKYVPPEENGGVPGGVNGTLLIADEGRIWIRGWHGDDSIEVRAMRTVEALSRSGQRGAVTCGECGKEMFWYGFESRYECSCGMVAT